jgi:glycosyltransferase involved in cell wall biosynthesis
MSDELVSVALPVRNGADGLARVVSSVLAQDHERIELVISDNASTDDTEEVCRELAARDGRIVYHRHPRNVGLLNNFVHAMRLATGTYLHWIGDDDWLAPTCISRSLDVFAADKRLILVTAQTAYTGSDGSTRTAPYLGTGLGSDDPVERVTEMLRLLNESLLQLDPIYSLIRRSAIVDIPRRNILHEDEVYATKLALAGPWGHVPEVLAHRNIRHDRLPQVARRLGVPAWQAHLATTLQCREILRWVAGLDLSPQQRRQVRAAVVRMHLRRQQRTAVHRSRKLGRLAASMVLPRREPARSAT